MMRRIAVATTLICVLGLAQPASAATKPAQVRPISVIKASTTSLTLKWSAASYAKKYEVFVSRHYDMSGAVRKSPGKVTQYTVRGLVRGGLYCFQVRALNGSTAGNKSNRTCKPTIVGQGATTGTQVKVMTYNVCSNPSKCANHSTERRVAPAFALITSRSPDVLALQEAGYTSTLDDKLVDDGGYTLAESKSSKRLYYKTAKFARPVATGSFMMADYGSASRWAVWAELVDRATGKHVIFVSAHTSSGRSSEASWLRNREVDNLQKELYARNTRDVPIVFAGDYNSNKSRSPDTPAKQFNLDGYYDSFDLARSLSRPNHNSYNGWEVTPNFGVKWGDHVDHIWVTPDIGVDAWESVAKFSGSGYSAPIPSDHNPVAVTLTVPQ